jgi:hypothetical protein
MQRARRFAEVAEGVGQFPCRFARTTDPKEWEMGNGISNVSPSLGEVIARVGSETRMPPKKRSDLFN